jgi:hypothetical protein
MSRLGDQFEAFTDGDLETLGGESRTQSVRHGFGVAEVAHISILCLNERGMPGLASLTRSFGQGVMKECDTFTVPQRAQAAGRIHLGEKMACCGGRVNVA